jgi:hypothetical protein
MKAIIFCIFKNISNGYRYNTDFDNQILYWRVF